MEITEAGMKKGVASSNTLWTSLLLFSVIFASFFLPLLPVALQRNSFRIVYSVIYISAIFSLERRNNYLIGLFIATVLAGWVSEFFYLPGLSTISKSVNVIFFLVIVISLIRQIAIAKNVTAGVILGSMVGYLLIGLIYSTVIAFILHHDPGAFSNQQITKDVTESGNASVSLYIGFVSLATLGFGDIVPLKPYTRSLAIWIAVSGQFYIAIIVALLVGKFSARKKTTDNPGSG